MPERSEAELAYPHPDTYFNGRHTAEPIDYIEGQKRYIGKGGYLPGIIPSIEKGEHHVTL